MAVKFQIEVNMTYDGVKVTDDGETVASLLQKAVENKFLQFLPWKIMGREAVVSFVVRELE